MLRISALTPGSQVPSSRYRVRQYIPALDDAGISVTEFSAKIDYSSKLPGVLGRIKQRYIFPISAAWIGLKAISRINDIVNSNSYDAVWLNRILANSIYMEKLILRPMIYDVDDAIWLNDSRITKKIAQKAEVIVAGNSFIAEWFSKINPNVHVIPTAIDTDKFFPSKQNSDSLFKIVWSGTQQTMHYLQSIEGALSVFMAKRKDILLVVISDIPPSFKQIPPEKIQFIKWTEESEIKAIQTSDIGIMPLFNTPWEQGKCSFKMLKYMSCGLPVIISPVGMNKEVQSKGNLGLFATDDKEWISSLEFFYNNPYAGKEMGTIGRQIIEKEYSLKTIADSLIQVFRYF